MEQSEAENCPGYADHPTHHYVVITKGAQITAGVGSKDTPVWHHGWGRHSGNVFKYHRHFTTSRKVYAYNNYADFITATAARIYVLGSHME